MQSFSDQVWHRVKHHVADVYPQEASGIIITDKLGRDYVRYTPRGFSDERSFHVPPSALIASRRRGDTFKAFYHSHPNSPPVASNADLIAMRSDTGPNWPGVDWIIVEVGQSGVKGYAHYHWSDEARGFQCHVSERLPC